MKQHLHNPNERKREDRENKVAFSAIFPFMSVVGKYFMLKFNIKHNQRTIFLSVNMDSIKTNHFKTHLTLQDWESPTGPDIYHAKYLTGIDQIVTVMHVNEHQFASDFRQLSVISTKLEFFLN